MKYKGPICYCYHNRPTAMNYVKHVLVISHESGIEISSSTWKCPKCLVEIAEPENYAKLPLNGVG